MNHKTAFAAASAAAVLLLAACSSRTTSVPVSWTAPSENVDGSALTDLAGYRVYWRRLDGPQEQSIEIEDVATTSYVLEGLEDGEWQVGVSAFTEDSRESEVAMLTFTIEDGEIVLDEGARPRTVASSELREPAHDERARR